MVPVLVSFWPPGQNIVVLLGIEDEVRAFSSASKTKSERENKPLLHAERSHTGTWGTMP
jgi:hypothetical protein